MTYQASLNHGIKKSGVPLSSAMPDERLYFSGLKKPLGIDDVIPMPKNNVTDTILDFISDNPVATAASTLIAGMGLYYGTKKTPIVPVVPPSEIYNDAIKSVMTGVAGLIAGSGVIKYMTQESLEVENLRRDIKQAVNDKKLEQRQKSMRKQPNRIINMQKKSENCDIDMTKLFQN